MLQTWQIFLRLIMRGMFFRDFDRTTDSFRPAFIHQLLKFNKFTQSLYNKSTISYGHRILHNVIEKRRAVGLGPICTLICLIFEKSSLYYHPREDFRCTMIFLTFEKYSRLHIFHSSKWSFLLGSPHFMTHVNGARCFPF